MAINRREFLHFMGYSALSLTILNQLTGCANTPAANSNLPFAPIAPSPKDDLILAKGIQSRILLKDNDLIGKDLRFGFSCDYNAFIPFKKENPFDGMLWTNHETPVSIFCSGYVEKPGVRKTKEQVDIEMQATGGSLVRFFKDSDGQWKVDQKSSFNRRLSGTTKIPFSKGYKIQGQDHAIGTLANCAGGITPWGHFLTCEENYAQFYGEWDYSPKPGEKKSRTRPVIKYRGDKFDYGWYNYYDFPSTHYGWVVEIHPTTGEAKKLVPLGRFAHEGATCVVAKNGCTVVYMGDDANDQCFYKFVSDKPGSLESGTLYVASLEKSRWLPLKMSSHPEFKTRFKDQTELLIRTREAAKIVGGTPLDRPEDVEINPRNGDVIVALTNNKAKGRAHGTLLKLTEKNADYLSLEFKAETWISGGENSRISCPDNMAFDKSGNLWVTNDISGDLMNRGAHKSFGNNGLYYIPMSGPEAGKVFQVASAPTEAEFTGPCFTPDGETLIISIQHPGEDSLDPKNPTSRWPDGHPQSAVIALSGESLSKMVNYRV